MEKPVECHNRPMRRVAGGLALLLVLSGCTADSSPASSLTTSGPATTTSGVPPTATTAAPPETTTTLAVTEYGDSLRITAVPYTRASGGEPIPDVFLPQLTYFDRGVSDENVTLRSFVADRVAAYGPDGPPPGYSLTFEVFWTGDVGRPLLSVVFAETAPAFDGGEPSEARLVLLFNLFAGESLIVADMLTPDGVQALRALVAGRVAEVLGEGFCCFSPEALVADVGVTAEGLVAYLDETDGVPHDVGPLEFLLPWNEVAPLVDMRREHLAGFAVDQGLCSTSGRQWVLEDQPGLPAAVADKRAAVFAAAVVCDYEGLEDLAGSGEGFTGLLPNGVHPGTAEAFRNHESWGRADLLWLVQTLNLDYAERTWTRDDGASGSSFVWPAAQAMPLAEVAPEQQAALQAIYPYPLTQYGYENSDGAFVFSGFHVNITPDGMWSWLGFNIA